ncbi:uncharacterized protein [Littorina saxatilis]
MGKADEKPGGCVPHTGAPSPPQPSSPRCSRHHPVLEGGAPPSDPTQLQQRLQRLHLIQRTAPLSPHHSSPSSPTPSVTPPPLQPLSLPQLSALAQRSDSPPNLSHLLHSRTSPLQRASPPPPSAFLNLCAIREDSADQQENDTEMVDEEHLRENIQVQGQLEALAALRRASSGTPPFRTYPACNPMISITDTHGHVTDVDTTGQEGGRDTGSPSSPVTRSDPRGQGQAQQSSVPSWMAGMSLAGSLSSYPFSFLQGFGLINTNLASIPPVNGDASHHNHPDLSSIHAWAKAAQSTAGGATAHSPRTPSHLAKTHPHILTSPTHHRGHSHASRFRRHNTFHDSRDMSFYNAYLASTAPLVDFSVSNRVLGRSQRADLHARQFASSPSSPTWKTAPQSGASPASFTGFFSQPASPLHQPSYGVCDVRETFSSPPSTLNSCFPSSSGLEPRFSAAAPSSHSDSNLSHSPYGVSPHRQSPVHPQSPIHSHSSLHHPQSPVHLPHPQSPHRQSPIPQSPHRQSPYSSPCQSPLLGERDLFGRSALDGSMSRLLELAPAGPRTVDDVVLAIKDALDSVCPSVAYERLEKRFRLQQADLEMEVEVCDGEGEIPPGLHVRKLSGDHTHYAALCNHLLACVNN